MSWLTRPIVSMLLGMIRGYQRFVSPMLGPRCRFYPSCSHYAGDALRHHGLFRGAGLAAWRILRCHPFHPGGHDPVPPSLSAATPGQAGDGADAQTTSVHP